MSKISFPVIPSDAMIDIKVSGTFYRKLLHLSLMLAESKPLDEYKTVLERLKTNAPELSLYEINVQTIMMLMHEIETCAKAQSKTKIVEVDTDDPETMKESTGN